MVDIKIIGDPISVLRIEAGLYSFDRAFVNAKGDLGLPITSIELYGPTHCGKTTMAVSLSGIFATLLKKDITLADMEGIHPEFLVNNLGNQGYSGKVYDARKETDEETLDFFVELLKKKDIGCGIFDSVAAISPIAELEGEHCEANMGKRAKLMAQHSRKLVHVLREQHKLVFYINHELTNIGGMAYRYTPGGDELKYLARIRMSFKRKEDTMTGADLLILLSDIDGLYTAPPQHDPDARFVEHVAAITPEIEEICLRAARSVGGGVLAVDLVEHPEKGLVVNEINHTMEFHTMQPVSGIDIAGEIMEYTVSAARMKDQ